MELLLREVKKNQQTILVLGLGKTGRAVVQFLAREGIKFRGVESETKENYFQKTVLSTKEKVFLDSHADSIFFGIKECSEAHTVGVAGVIASPGISTHGALFKSINHLPVFSELEVGLSFIEGTSIVITGTNGKSTVTALIGHILKSAKKEVIVGGNIGIPLVDLLPQGVVQGNKLNTDFLVIEASSYQLELFRKYNPDIGVFLNLSENHLERHGTLENYFHAKMNLFKLLKPEGACVVDGETTWGQKAASESNAQNKFIITQKEKKARILDALPLIGAHNKSNAAIAVSVCSICEIQEPLIADALRSFTGLPHRLEVIRNHPLVLNDSKATTVDATLIALEAVVSQFPSKKIVLMIGGIAKKGSDWKKLSEKLTIIKNSIEEIVFFGQSGAELEAAIGWGGEVQVFSSLLDATKAVMVNSDESKVILLSPACLSFDEFRDFEDRGDQFRSWVQASR